MENQQGKLSTYQIGMQAKGKASVLKEQMQLVADLYVEQGQLKDKKEKVQWKTFGGFVLSGLLIIVAMMTSFFSEPLHFNRLILTILFLFGTWAIIQKRPWWAERSAFHIKVERLTKDIESFSFKRDSDFSWHYVARYRKRERAFAIAERVNENCQVYKLDYPLVPDAKLPSGIDLLTYWLFESDGAYFQVAVGKELKDEDSYMILHVPDALIKLNEWDIKQSFNVYTD